MPQHEIQPYEPATLSDGPEPLRGAASQGRDLASLLLGVLRRWRVVLLVWLLVAPLGLAAAWKMVLPSFTATALVEVAPAVTPILIPDATPSMPNYDSYLNTQAEIIVSRQMLLEALADPNVQDVPLLAKTDPVADLQRNLTVSTVSRTQLLEIAVRQDSRDAALRLTRAVLDAYMTRAVGLDSQAARHRREILLGEQQTLRKQMAALTERIRALAEQVGTASETVFNTRRQGLEVTIAGDKQKLEELDLQILDLEQQLRQLDQGGLPEDLAAQREQMIESDPGVRYVKKDIDDKTAALTRLQLSLADARRDSSAASKAVERQRLDGIAAVQATLEQLQAELERARARAAVAADREIQRRQQQRVQDARQRLTGVLAAAKQKRDLLRNRVASRDAEGLTVGRQGLEIQTLTEQRAQAKLDYDRVSDALRQLDIEGQRPARISVAAAPEVRPTGIKDRRIKLSLLVMMMAAGLACGVGLLRELLDPHVNTVEQVEAGIGLRMLGAVPSVKELRAGRISREHFLESYRLIRTSLASLGDDGNPPRSILITSAQAAEGKTSLAVSLAISLAEPGCRVLLVDGDIQSPQIGRLLNAQPRGDLRQVLLGERDLDQCVTRSAVEGLDLLTGHINGQTARSALNLRTARHLVRLAVQQYDHVIVDSPPALGAADSLVWASATEGVIVTSLVGYSDRKAIRLACQRLVSVGAKLLGSVVANVSMNESYYSYSTTSCRGEGSLGLAHKGGPPHRTAPLVHLPKEGSPARRGGS